MYIYNTITDIYYVYIYNTITDIYYMYIYNTITDIYYMYIYTECTSTQNVHTCLLLPTNTFLYVQYNCVLFKLSSIYQTLYRRMCKSCVHSVLYYLH